jgi:antitoxin component of MazEF toxin-antitoxin module
MPKDEGIRLEDDYSLRLPADVVKKLHLRRGTRLYLREGKGSLVLMTAREREVWEGFRGAVEQVRREVASAGGVTDAEVEAAVKRVRANKGRH